MNQKSIVPSIEPSSLHLSQTPSPKSVHFTSISNIIRLTYRRPLSWLLVVHTSFDTSLSLYVSHHFLIYVLFFCLRSSTLRKKHSILNSNQGSHYPSMTSYKYSDSFSRSSSLSNFYTLLTCYLTPLLLSFLTLSFRIFFPNGYVLSEDPKHEEVFR